MPQNELEYTVALLFFGTQKGRPTKSCARKDRPDLWYIHFGKTRFKKKRKNKGEFIILMTTATTRFEQG
jgi:hypothetical protein